jgi:hypothetical protein
VSHLLLVQQTGDVTGSGQLVRTSTNPSIKFGITIGSSIIEMKVTISLGTQDGELQCAAPAAASARRSLAPGHGGGGTGGGSHSSGGSGHGLVVSPGTAAALRQNSLTALILVIPSSIDSLSDAFGSISNAFDFRSTFGSGGSGGGGAGGGTAATAGSTSGPPSSGYKGLVGALSAYINANTITIAVVTAVSASVGNVVAASSVSNTASLTNAFQMVGHAQCEMSEMRPACTRTNGHTEGPLLCRLVGMCV